MKQKAKHIRLLESMSRGKTFSARQIVAIYKVANPHDLVYKIENKLGVQVFRHLNKSGVLTYSV